MGDLAKKSIKASTGGALEKPKPDQDLKRVQRQQEEDLRSKKSEIAEREAAKRRFGQGRSSLLSGSAIGVKDTLG